LELSKKKYKKSEVLEIVDKVKEEFSDEVDILKQRIDELKKENLTLSSSLNEYKNKEALINSSIERAEEKARETDKVILAKYSLEIENIKVFCARFNTYFDYLLKKYPYYPEIQKAKETYEKLLSISNNQNLTPAERIRKSNKLFGKGNNVTTPDGNVFDPKAKIDEYIAATGDNGFNLDEVLNPGELRLEDLCKELGLTEEEL
jgi:cell division septum initiation protein DivIVA